MIQVYVAQAGGRWFGVAAVGERLVATAAGGSRGQALGHLRRSLPEGAPHEETASASAFGDRMIRKRP